MKFLKGLALFILSFLLFLSLSILGLALMINQTILNPDFVIAQVDRLDIASLAGEMLSEQVPPEVDELTGEAVAKVISDTITDLEPWLKEQAGDAVYSIYYYLEGRSQSLSLVISLEPMKQSLRENLGEAALQASPAAIESYLEKIPSTFEFNEASLGAEGMAQFEQARQYVGYFHLGYKLLIVFILLLIAGIVLINRQVKGATRAIGSTFLSYGIPSYAGILVAKHLAGTQIAQLDIPTSLQTWLPQLIKDTLAPLEMFSLGLLVTGVALLIVSFVYKRGEPSS